MDPKTALEFVVALVDPIVTAWRAPAAVVLFAAVVFRPKHESRCVMIGRVLVCIACAFWFVAGVFGFESASRIGDWTMFLSAMATHVCEVFMNLAAVLEAKRGEGPSPLGRIWSAARAPRRAP